MDPRLSPAARLSTLIVMVFARATLLAVPLAAFAFACGGGAGAPVDAAIDGAGDASLLLPDAGAAGYALKFDGIKEYATAANAGFPPVGAALSVELWVSFASVASTQDFIVMRTDLDSGVRVGIRAGTVAASRVYVDRALVQAPIVPSIVDWHHVAYTSDGTVHTLYIDGAVVDSGSPGNDTRTPTSAWLGSLDGSTELFAGQMDEVRVWSIARSATDVKADMHHGSAGAQAGLVAYWTFDDPRSGGRSLDSSGLHNDVTLGDGVVALMPARVPSMAPVGN
jgi:hypothetical protein